MCNNRSLILDCIHYSINKNDILKGVYIRVEAGEICGIVGRNGTGKTTLLKIASGQIAPTTGIVILNGKRLHTKSIRNRFSKIAYLPQNSMIPKDLTTGKFISKLPIDSSVLKNDEVINSLLNIRIDKLSVGKRKYLEVQIVLNLNREYVLLDEPFTGLEPTVIEKLSSSIKSAAQNGKGILITDHYYHYLLPILDTAYVLNNNASYKLEKGKNITKQLKNFNYL